MMPMDGCLLLFSWLVLPSTVVCIDPHSGVLVSCCFVPVSIGMANFIFRSYNPVSVIFRAKSCFGIFGILYKPIEC